MMDRRSFLAAAAAACRAGAEEAGASYYGRWKKGLPSSSDYFPICVWLQDPKNAARYEALGVNLYVGLWRGPTGEQLEQLAAAGMPALTSQNEAGMKSDLVRGWLMRDEPDNAQAKPGGGWGSCILPPEVMETANGLRAKDATRPVFLNLGQAVINTAYKGRGSVCSRHDEHYPEYIKAADIVSYDVYPVNYKLPLWYVGAGVRRLREWANYGKPVWNWIETASIHGGPQPTPEQIESEVWMSIINGSMGIGYFCHQFGPQGTDAAPLRDQKTGAALAAINRRITSLAPVLNQPAVTGGVQVDSGNPELPVEVMLKRHRGKTYLFAIGARPEATAQVTFTLRGAGDLKGQVLGESRAVRVRGGVLRDTFSGYQHRIYELG